MDLDDENENPNVSSKLPYWNNWKPENNTIDARIRSEVTSARSGKKLIQGGNLNISRSYAVERKVKYKNWIPSRSLKKTNVRSELKLLRSGGNSSTHETEHATQKNSSCDETQILKLNEDWGRRTSLHNIFHINEGDKVWNVINRGLFAEIRLSVNEYGNICCKASGKISVKGDSEKSIVEINTMDNLRKLLNLSQMQWSSLCEVVQEKNCELKFSAYDDVNLDEQSAVEKLWFFICKRRHFLPSVCVSGKLSGAVKVMKELKIMPKIIITEVRDFKGDEIS